MTTADTLQRQLLEELGAAAGLPPQAKPQTDRPKDGRKRSNRSSPSSSPSPRKESDKRRSLSRSEPRKDSGKKRERSESDRKADRKRSRSRSEKKDSDRKRSRSRSERKEDRKRSRSRPSKRSRSRQSKRRSKRRSRSKRKKSRSKRRHSSRDGSRSRRRRSRSRSKSKRARRSRSRSRKGGKRESGRADSRDRGRNKDRHRDRDVDRREDRRESVRDRDTRGDRDRDRGKDRDRNDRERDGRERERGREDREREGSRGGSTKPLKEVASTGPPLDRHKGATRDTKPAWMSKGLGINTQMFGESTGELMKPGLTKTDLEELEKKRDMPDRPDPFGEIFAERGKVTQKVRPDEKKKSLPAQDSVFSTRMDPSDRQSPSSQAASALQVGGPDVSPPVPTFPGPDTAAPETLPEKLKEVECSGPPLERHRGAVRDTKPAWMTKGLGVNTDIFGNCTGELMKPGMTKSDLEALEKKGFLGPDPFGEIFAEKQGSPHSAQTSCGARQPLPPQDDVFAIKTGVPPPCRPPSVVGVPAPCRPPSVVPAPCRPPMVVNGGLGGVVGGCGCGYGLMGKGMDPMGMSNVGFGMGPLGKGMDSMGKGVLGVDMMGKGLDGYGKSMDMCVDPMLGKGMDPFMGKGVDPMMGKGIDSLGKGVELMGGTFMAPMDDQVKGCEFGKGMDGFKGVDTMCSGMGDTSFQGTWMQGNGALQWGMGAPML